MPDTDLNCSLSWQKEFWRNGSVKYDPDIVGPGVLSAFVATAGTALLTLIIGLATHSMPVDLINDVDRAVIDLTRRTFISIRKFLGIPALSHTDDEDARGRRVEGLQMFLLSISDQILVSEIAILIAVWIGKTKITLYSTNVVIALACLASTVHLSTLSIMATYLQIHSTMLFSRIICMVFGAASLVILLVWQASSPWADGSHVFFTCAIHDLRGSGNDFLTAVSGYLPAVLLVFAHVRVITNLFQQARSSHYSAQPHPGGQTPAFAPSQISSQCKTVSTRRRRAFYANSAQETSWIRPRPLRLKAMYYCESWAFYECSDSFSFRILWLVSGCTYGITDVFTQRSYRENLSGDPNEMGFGQIVPLVLLLLPMITAVDAILSTRFARLGNIFCTDLFSAYRKGIKADAQNRLKQDTSKSAPERQAQVRSDDNTKRQLAVHMVAPVSPDRGPDTHRGAGSPNLVLHPSSPNTDCAVDLLAQSSLLHQQGLQNQRANSKPSTSGTGRATTFNSLFEQWTDTSSDSEPLRWPLVKAFVAMHWTFMLIFAPLLGWSLASDVMPSLAILALCILLLCLTVRKVWGIVQMRLYIRRKGSAFHYNNDRNTAQAFDPARTNIQGHAVTEVAEHSGERQV